MGFTVREIPLVQQFTTASSILGYVTLIYNEAATHRRLRPNAHLEYSH